MSDIKGKAKLYVPVMKVIDEQYVVGVFKNLDLAHDAVLLFKEKFKDSGKYNIEKTSAEVFEFTVDILSSKKFK